MSTTFPGAVDYIAALGISDAGNNPHQALHMQLGDAVMAMQTAMLGMRLDLAASVVVPGATSFSIRDHANANNNLLITDVGAATFANRAIAGGGALLTLAPGNHTEVTAEYQDIVYTGPTIAITGSYANQRFIKLNAPTITSASPFTVTSAATFEIEGGPIAAGSATIGISKIAQFHGTGVFSIESSGLTDSTHAVSLHVNSVLADATNSSFLRGIWSNNNYTVGVGGVAEGIVETATITAATDSSGQYYHYPTKLTVNAGVTLAVVDGFHLDTPVMTGNVVRYNGITIQNLGSVNVTNDVGVSIEAQSGATNTTHLLIGTLTTGNWAIYSSSTMASKLAGTLTNLGTAVIGTTLNAAHGLRVDIATLVGSTQMGLVADATAASDATGNFWQIFTRVHFAAAAFTNTFAAAIEVDTPSYGAGSAATSAAGIRITNQGAAAVGSAYGINILAQSGASTNIGIFNADDYCPTPGSTGMTKGFNYIPSAAGAPSGAPTNLVTGRVAMYYDETNNFLYVRKSGGAWVKSTVYA